MNKLAFSIAGAAVALASTVAIVDYSVRKKKGKNASAGLLTVGVIGFLIGATLPVVPVIDADKKKLALPDIMDDENTALVSKSIAEILSRNAEVSSKNKPLQEIELDEETSIEDFI